MASINITGTGAPHDFATGATVGVAAIPATGSTYLWEFLDKPEGSTAAFANPALPATSFVADIEGTYLVKVTIDGADTGQAVAVVPYQLTSGPVSTLIAPAAGETLEKDPLTGWARAIQDHTKVIAWLVSTGIAGGVEYKGTWNANTNTPDLVAATPDKGDYYVISVAGNTDLDGLTDWEVGDWAIYNGTVWEKVDNTDITAVLTAADKDLSPSSAVTVDGGDTGLDISVQPLGWIGVLVNGVMYVVGDGVKTKDFYFSADGGTTAKAISAIVATDSLYFNAVIAGFDLLTAHRVDMMYEVLS